MTVNEKTIWKKASIFGLIFSFLCLCVSVYQFYSYTEAVTFSNAIRRLTSLTINVVMFVCFILIMFKPRNFNLYAIALYIYGFGNLLDGGHMLGFVCMSLSALFIYFIGGFDKHRVIKIILLIIPAIIGIVAQCFNQSPFFAIITLFHGFGMCLMSYLAFCLVYPKIQEYKNNKIVHPMDSGFYSERDVSWLNQVLEGKRYVDIAANDLVSESTVKARMSEIYKSLGISGKAEFVATYRNRKFSLDDTQEFQLDSTEQKQD